MKQNIEKDARTIVHTNLAASYRFYSCALVSAHDRKRVRTCLQRFLQNEQLKRLLDVSVNSAPDDSRAIGLNDIDFPKEFSYV